MFVKNLGCPVHFCVKRNFWGRVPTRFLHCKCIATFCYEVGDCTQANKKKFDLTGQGNSSVIGASRIHGELRKIFINCHSEADLLGICKKVLLLIC